MPDVAPIAPTPYVRKVLMGNEFVVYKGRLHWYTLVPATIFAAITTFCAIYLLIWINADKNVAGALLVPTPAIEATTTDKVATAVITWGAYLILAIGLVLVLRALIERAYCEIAVTNIRVIFKKSILWRIIGEKALLRRLSVEARLDSLSSIVVDQSIFGRMLDYGTIVVRGISSEQPFTHVADPFALKRAVEEEIHKIKG
jgi:hypothetical protein